LIQILRLFAYRNSESSSERFQDRTPHSARFNCIDTALTYDLSITSIILNSLTARKA